MGFAILQSQHTATPADEVCFVKLIVTVGHEVPGVAVC